MKKALSILLALSLILCYLKVEVKPVSAESDGEYIYTISGSSVEITGYTGGGGVIAIPETLGGYPVVGIGDNAFSYHSNLTNVTVPDSVASIGGGAFRYCSNLTGITLPTGLTSINAFLFTGCSKLENITIPNSVTDIVEEAFLNCTSLTNITIPDNVESIWYNAFASCSQLSVVTIGSGLTSMDASAFANCTSLIRFDVDTDNPTYSSLDGVLFNRSKTTLIQYPMAKTGDYIIPDSVTTISTWAFTRCKGLSSVTTGSGMTSIQNELFFGCSELVSVAIGDSVTSIGIYPFIDCNKLTTITLGSGVENIDMTSFSYCTGLTQIIVDTNNPYFTSQNGVLFNEDKSTLIKCPAGKSGSYDIPGNVKSITDNAFAFCEKLTGITNLDNVVNIGGGAFRYCSNLTGITLPTGLTSINAFLFKGCSKLTDITIPSTVTDIVEEAFSNCTSLTDITIPDSVESIWYNAFAYCTQLSVASIGSRVTSMGDLVFSGCSSLTQINVDAANTCFLSQDGVLFDKTITTLIQYPAAKTGGFVIPDSVTVISTGAFTNCTGLNNVTIGSGITSIPYALFSGCRGLVSVDTGNRVTRIDGWAFTDCTNLATMAFGNSVASIDDYSFITCDNLNQINVSADNPNFSSRDGVLFNKNASNLIFCPEGKTGEYTIPDGTVTISEHAFSHCAKLTRIRMPDSVDDIGGGAFLYCTNLTGVILPSGLTSINAFLFKGCGKLADIAIPSTVTDIVEEAFMYCTSLTSITVPDRVTSIWYNAFSFCSNLESAYFLGNAPVMDFGVFDACDENFTVYYLAGKTGFSSPAWNGYPSEAMDPSVSYSVTYDSNGAAGGTVPVDSNAYAANAVVEVLANTGHLTKDSFTFAGWNTKADGSGIAYYESGTFSMGIGNVTLYALWVRDETPGEPQQWVNNGITWNYTPLGTDYCSVDGCSPASGALVIPGSINGRQVIEMGDSAFYNCPELTGVTIPNSVTSIGDSAFVYCIGLTNVTMPDNLISIGDSAFFYCAGLTSMTIPNSVINMGDYVFYGCNGLTSVTIGSGLDNISSGVFTGCSVLTQIMVDNDNSQLSSSDGVLFDKSKSILIRYPGGKAGSYIIPDSVSEVGSFAFHSCEGLTSITIPDSVTSIGVVAFYDCIGLTSVNILNSVTSISNDAFSSCTGLTRVMIGRGVTSMGYGVFNNCSALTEITVDENNTQYTSLDGVLFDKSRFELLQYPGGKIGSYIIPDGVDRIGYCAFNNCAGLSGVTIPNSVTVIGTAAFDNCTGLTSVIIGSGVTRINSYAFGCSNLSSAYFLGNAPSIDSDAFYNCAENFKVYYLASKTGFSSPTWHGYATEEFDPNQTHTVTYDANGASSGAVPVDLNNYAYTAPVDVVGNTGNLSNPTYIFTGWNTNADGSGISYDESGAFVMGFENVTLYAQWFRDETLGEPKQWVNDSITWDYTPLGTDFCRVDGCSPVTGTLVIPSIIDGRLTIKIGDEAFYHCTGLISVSIPDSITSIGEYAFAYCQNLTSITIPDKVTRIGEGAFSECSALTQIIADSDNTQFSSSDGVLFNKDQSVLLQYPGGKEGSYVIPDSVTSIRDYAFYYCTELNGVTIPNSATSVGYRAFNHCTGLTGITIPDSIVSIGAYAFDDCEGLVSVTIGKGVTNFGYSAFGNCRELTQINVDQNNTQYSSLDGVLFNRNQSILLQYPAGIAGNYSIPYSVSDIGDQAFDNCTELTGITIPDSVDSIGGWAFYNCTGLNSLTIPDSVTSIGGYAFYCCYELNSVVIGERVTSIGNGAFSYCSNLKAAYFLGNAPEMYYGVFDNGAEDFTLYYIEGKNGFSNPTWNNYSSAVFDPAFPHSVIYNGNGASSRDAPVDSNTYGYNASVEVIDIGNMINPTYTFVGWNTKADGSGVYYAVDDTLIMGFENVTLYAMWYRDEAPGEPQQWENNGITWDYTPLGTDFCRIDGCDPAAGDIVIPEYVDGRLTIEIGNDTFSKCIGVTSVTIPDSVVSIGNNAFRGCDGLTQIIIGSNNGQYSSLDGVLFNKDQSTLLLYPGGKTGNYIIPDTVTGLVTMAFYECKELTGVTIPAGVTENVEGMFIGCSRLIQIIVDLDNPVYSSFDGVLFNKNKTTLIQYPGGKIGSYTIPNSVTSIGYGSFHYCTGLTSVSIPASITSIGYSMFTTCTGLTQIDVDNNNTQYSSLDGVLFNKNKTTLIQYPCGKTGSYTVPNSVTSIGNGAFFYCTGLTQIDVDSNNTQYSSLDGVLFNKNKTTLIQYPGGKTGSYTIPNSVTSIGEGAFFYCTGLTDVSIPVSIVNIGAGAFYYCTGLTNVNIPNSVTSIGGYAFYNCTGLKGIIISRSVTSIGDYTFYNCTNIQSIIIPSSISSIGYGAFLNCCSLSAAYFLGDEPKIYGDIFENCSLNITVYYRTDKAGFSSPTWNGYLTATFDGIYTITFRDWNDEVISEQEVEYGSAAVAPANPIRTGYTFIGWDTAFDNIMTDFAVTAQYTIRNFSVTFNSMDGSAVPSITADYNTLISEPTAPTRSGFTFGGWYKEIACTNLWNASTDTIIADTTLYAKWTANCIKGDATGDGKVDALDLLKVKKHLLGQLVIAGDNALAADTTGDGKIDALDLLKIKKYLLGQIVL